MYEEGRGVARSTTRANKWKRLAEAQGLAPDPATSALVEPVPAAVAPDPSAMEADLASAAEPAPAAALPEVEPAPDAPTSELRQRALAGEADAGYALGRKYATGEGVPQSGVEAGRWYLAAAEQGHATAAYLLAFQYLRGQGIAERRELARAHYWFAVSAAGGIADGAVWRDRVEKKMSRRELEQARALFDQRQASR
jgi:TPR repeat protein